MRRGDWRKVASELLRIKDALIGSEVLIRPSDYTSFIRRKELEEEKTDAPLQSGEGAEHDVHARTHPQHVSDSPCGPRKDHPN